jgi:hypothetical protein
LRGSWLSSAWSRPRSASDPERSLGHGRHLCASFQFGMSSPVSGSRVRHGRHPSGSSSEFVGTSPAGQCRFPSEGEVVVGASRSGRVVFGSVVGSGFPDPPSPSLCSPGSAGPDVVGGTGTTLAGVPPR